MKLLRYILIALLLATGITAQASREERALRRHVAAGNALYAEKRYAEAEVEFKKALEADATSAVATFNLASALIRQAGTGESGQKIMESAQQLLTKALEMGNEEVAELAAYNLGNIAYNAQQYDQAINRYKQALRLNPDNDKARENLRLAQLKKKDQNQNQDKNQDKQDQQDKQDKQDKQDQQDKKDQQDKQDQQKQNQDKQQQQQQPQQPQQGSMSDENAEKILKAMENEEAKTRRRIQEQENREKANASRRVVTKPW